jgi:Emfourin
MRVRVVRRGGLAGIPMTAEVDTVELGQPAAEQAEQALQRAQCRSAASPPPAPDRFSFHLSLPESNSDQDIAIDERDVPNALRPLLDLAGSRARPGRGPESDR